MPIFSGGIGTPSLLTVSVTAPDMPARSTRIGEPWKPYWIALPSRFEKTCPIRALSHSPIRPPDMVSAIGRRGWTIWTSSTTCCATNPMFIMARTTGSPEPNRARVTSSRLLIRSLIRRALSSTLLMSIVWRSLSVPMCTASSADSMIAWIGPRRSCPSTPTTRSFESATFFM